MLLGAKNGRWIHPYIRCDLVSGAVVRKRSWALAPRASFETAWNSELADLPMNAHNLNLRTAITNLWCTCQVQFVCLNTFFSRQACGSHTFAHRCTTGAKWNANIGERGQSITEVVVRAVGQSSPLTGAHIQLYRNVQWCSPYTAKFPLLFSSFEINETTREGRIFSENSVAVIHWFYGLVCIMEGSQKMGHKIPRQDCLFWNWFLSLYTNENS